jgi:hypothetical protein
MMIELHAHFIPAQSLREATPADAWQPRIYRDERGRQMLEYSCDSGSWGGWRPSLGG